MTEGWTVVFQCVDSKLQVAGHFFFNVPRNVDTDVLFQHLHTYLEKLASCQDRYN